MARRSDHTREQIKAMAIAAAHKLVSDSGRNQLSARKVAKEIGYTVGSLYLVFENFDDLILHVNAGTLDELQALLGKAASKADNPADALCGIARAYIQYAREQPDLWSLAMEYKLPEGYPIPDWFLPHSTGMFALPEGILRPVIPEEAKRKAAALALWGGVHGLCVLGLAEKIELFSDTSIESISDDLIRGYLAGVEGGS